jgi:hypothetical protein
MHGKSSKIHKHDINSKNLKQELNLFIKRITRTHSALI